MRRIAAVGVDDDLAPGKAGVAHRTADDKPSRRVHEELRVAVKQLRRKIRLDDLLHNRLAQIGNRDIRRVLRGYNDRVDPLDLAVLAILHGNLTLAVRPEPRKAAVLSRLCQRLCQIVCVRNRGRHQLLGFVAGKAEHHTLIARALLIRVVIGRIHAHRDILRLLVDCCQNRAASAIEAELRVIVADLRDRVSRNARNVHIAVRRNFAHYQHKARRRRALARHTRLRVLGQNRVQYAV